jgi:hypothetical protein
LTETVAFGGGGEWVARPRWDGAEVRPVLDTYGYVTVGYGFSEGVPTGAPDVEDLRSGHSLPPRWRRSTRTEAFGGYERIGTDTRETRLDRA